jgi:Xaa-Pro aminopeptidase
MPAESAPRTHDDTLHARLRAEGPMNLPRAYDVMERFGLDGLVVADPVNVFHVLGYWPQIANTKVGAPPTTFALLTRDARQAPGLVTSRFIYYYTYADGGFLRDLQVHLFRDAVDAGPIDAAAVVSPGPAAAPPAGALEFPDRHLAPLTAVERRRRGALDAAVAARGSSVDAGSAIVRALKDMGLWHGRIATDHPLIDAVCERHGRPGTLVAGENVLRWIRLVKSPLEIQLMRRASFGNVEAVAAVGRAIRAGATYAELRQAFEVEAARRGNRAVFLTVDRVSSELSDDTVVDGQTFFIDGVSHWRHYHGDFARTVFVGEPLAEARRAAQTVAHAWNAVRERLRPGLRYSEIVAIGREAVRAGGSGLTVGFGPHSVGLMHTDEPGEDAGGFHRKIDLALEPGMILSVDCPVMDTGVGGSAHLEDLMLITSDGAEPIHALGEPVIVV